jgi:hypothetical protein
MQILEQPVLEIPKHTKQLLKQKTFSSVLRNTKREQCYCNEAIGEKRCAIGVIMEELYGFDYGSKWQGAYRLHREVEWLKYRKQLENVLKDHGLWSTHIQLFNDADKLSFSEIANFLESKGL